jgi:hypothetical protein
LTNAPFVMTPLPLSYQAKSFPSIFDQLHTIGCANDDPSSQYWRRQIEHVSEYEFATTLEYLFQFSSNFPWHALVA